MKLIIIKNLALREAIEFSILHAVPQGNGKSVECRRSYSGSLYPIGYHIVELSQKGK